MEVLAFVAPDGPGLGVAPDCSVVAAEEVPVVTSELVKVLWVMLLMAWAVMDCQARAVAGLVV